MELNEKQFIAGFNNGYLLAKHAPELLHIFLNEIKNITSYISGMSYGEKEFELEQARSQIDDLAQLRRQGKDELNKERE